MALTPAQITSYIAKAQRSLEVSMLSIVEGKRSGKKGDSLYYPNRFLSAGIDVLNSNHGLNNLQIEIIVQEMIEQGNLNDFSGDPIPYLTNYIVNPSSLNIKITDLVDGPNTGGPLTSWANYFLRVKPDGSAFYFVPQSPFSITTQYGITAHAGGGQTGATQLTANYCYITTVTSPDDSVMMEFAIPDVEQSVQNMDAANDLDIYPSPGDRFLSYGTLYAIDAPFILSAGQQTKWVCAVPKIWILS